MSNEERPLATDDAVSNRSDDTALDESEGARANGQESAEDKKPSFSSAAEKVEVAQADEAGVVPADPTATAKEIGEGGDGAEPEESGVATEEDIAAAAAEEAKVAPRGPIEEIKDEPE